MKKYIIRKAGWSYNDYTFEREGVMEIVRTFDDRAEAEAYLRFLDREYLFDYFPTIDRLEGGHPGMQRREYLQRLGSLLISEFGFNPTVGLPLSPDYSLQMFPDVPSDEQIDKLIDALELSFFRLVELPEEHSGFFYAYVHPNYSSGEKAYLYNYYGDKKLFFTSMEEAMHRLRENEWDYFFTYSVWKDLPPDTEGKWSELPDVLDALVQRSRFLHFEEDRLVLSGNADIETLLELNALLTVPFLAREPMQLSGSDQYPEANINEKRRDNDGYLAQVEERRANYPSVEALTASEEYVNLFRSRLPADDRFNDYPEVIRRHVARLTQTEMHLEMRIPSMCCAAVSHEEISTGHKLIMHFGFGHALLFDGTQPSVGSGKEPEEAIAACLEDWFVKNENLLRQKMLEMNLL